MSRTSSSSRPAHQSGIKKQYCEKADLVIEVVSEKNRPHDIKKKRIEYARAGIPEYWIVDPEKETITVLVLKSKAEDLRRVRHVSQGRAGRVEAASGFHGRRDGGFIAEAVTHRTTNGRSTGEVKHGDGPRKRREANPIAKRASPNRRGTSPGCFRRRVSGARKTTSRSTRTASWSSPMDSSRSCRCPRWCIN